jgi:hypothetical protein
LKPISQFCRSRSTRRESRTPSLASDAFCA